MKRLTSIFLASILAILVLPAGAHGSRFPGPSPIPLQDTVWIILDGASAGGGGREANALEQAAIELLRLQRGKTLFHWTPKDSSLATLATTFSITGSLGRSIAEIAPSTILLIVTGRDASGNILYGREPMTAEWIGKRMADLRRLSPQALLLGVIDACIADLPTTILNAAGPTVAPVHLLLGAGPERCPSQTLPVAQLAKEAAEATPGAPGGQGDIHRFLAPLQQQSSSPLLSLFLVALLGAADDPDGNGYDIQELAAWIRESHARLSKTSAKGTGGSEAIVAHALWGDMVPAATRLHLLKRRRYAIGVCMGNIDVLEPLPGERFDATFARTRKELLALADAVAQGARASLGTPNATVEAVTLDVDPLGHGETLEKPAQCAPAKVPAIVARYDAWLNLYHKTKGRYSFTLSQAQIHKIMASAPSTPFPDAAGAKQLLLDGGRSLIHLPALEPPPPIATPGPPNTPSLASAPATTATATRSGPKPPPAAGLPPSGVQKSAPSAIPAAAPAGQEGQNTSPIAATSAVPRTPMGAQTPGLIFIFDRSLSMSEQYNREGEGADPRRVKRLGLLRWIIERAIADHRLYGHQAIPYAIIAFGGSAEIVEVQSQHWFDATNNDALSRVRYALQGALLDNGTTNLESALVAAGKLIQERPGIAPWHVVLATDGVPTDGLVEFDKLALLAKEIFGGKAILSALTLFGRDRTYTNELELQRLVQSVSDGAGRRGITVSAHVDDPPVIWQSGADRIASLITQQTILRSFQMPCQRFSRHLVRCELRSVKEDRIRLGELQEVTYSFTGSALSVNKCSMVVTNERLPTGRILLTLPARGLTYETEAKKVRIRLWREKERIFLHIRALEGELNGDWHIQVTLGKAS